MFQILRPNTSVLNTAMDHGFVNAMIKPSKIRSAVTLWRSLWRTILVSVTHIYTPTCQHTLDYSHRLFSHSFLSCYICTCLTYRTHIQKIAFYVNLLTAGSHFVSLFDNEGEMLLGHSADELSELVRNGDTGKVRDPLFGLYIHIYYSLLLAFSTLFLSPLFFSCVCVCFFSYF